MTFLQLPKPLAEHQKKMMPPSDFRLTLPKPYAEWQQHLITSECKIILCILGTKCGKTLGGSARLARFSFMAPAAQNSLFRIVAPTYALSEITYRYLDRLIPEKPRYQENLSPEQNRIAAEIWARNTLERADSRRTFRWPHNNAKIQCVHGQDPEVTIEGERTHGNLLDEIAKLKEQVWASVTSTTTQTGGWIAGVGTPRGRTWLYKLYLQILEHMKECEKKGIPYKMFACTVPTWTSPFVSSEVLEHAKKILPDRIWRQLYGAEFVDSSELFLNLNAAFDNAVEFESDVRDWIAESFDGASISIGVDWAKSTDYTVFTALNEKGELIGFKRFNKVEYTSQVKSLFDFIERLRGHSREAKAGRPLDINVKHDETGIGAVLRDIIDKTPIPSDVSVTGVIWNNKRKEDAVSDLMLSFEEGALHLKPFEELKSELSVFECNSTKTGLPDYRAPDGAHDDCVMSLVLANWLYRDSRYSSPILVTIDPLQERIAYLNMTGQFDELQDLLG
jgi:hypothetical protein